jgi:hypothetical protein
LLPIHVFREHWLLITVLCFQYFGFCSWRVHPLWRRRMTNSQVRLIAYWCSYRIFGVGLETCQTLEMTVNWLLLQWHCTQSKIMIGSIPQGSFIIKVLNSRL